MVRQARYMLGQLVETKRSADAAHATAESAEQAIAFSKQTQRAVVLIEKVIGLPEPQSIHDTYFKPETVIAFTLKNYGWTVANAVALTVTIYTPKGSFDAKLPTVTIAPQAIVEWITVSLRSKVVTNESINQINNAEAKLIYEAFITYRDVFDLDHKHRTTGQYMTLLRKFIVSSSS